VTAAPTTYLKLHGIARSGTNWLRAVLDANLMPEVRVLVNVLGWKHGYPWDWREWLDAFAERDLLRAAYTERHRSAPGWFPHSAAEIRAAVDAGRALINRHVNPLISRAE